MINIKTQTYIPNQIHLDEQIPSYFSYLKINGKNIKKEQLKIINEKIKEFPEYKTIIEFILFFDHHKGKLIKPYLIRGKGKTINEIIDMQSLSQEKVYQLITNNNISDTNELINKIKNLNINEFQIIYEKVLLETNFSQDLKDISTVEYNVFLFNKINQLLIDNKIINKKFDKRYSLINTIFIEQNHIIIDIFINSIGFIPYEIYSKAAFNNITFSQVCQFHNYIRQKENEIKQYPDSHQQLQQIRAIRAYFIQQIFIDKKGKQDKTIKGICNSQQNAQQNQILLDSNGVRIRINKGKDKLNSHIPYGLCNDNICEYWYQNNWLGKSDYIELKKLIKLNSGQDYKSVEIQQTQDWFEVFGIKNSNDSQTNLTQLWLNIETNLTQSTTNIIQNKLILNDLILKHLNQKPIQEKITILFALAENIISQLSNEKLSDTIEMFTNYELAYRSRNSKNIRSKFLNQDKQYYNILIILNEILSNNFPDNNIKNDFFLFVGKYVTNDQQQSFIQLINNKKSYRILFQPNKNISQKAKTNLQKLPTFDQEKYENIELFLRSYNLCLESIKLIKSKTNNKITLINYVYNEIKSHITNLVLFSLNYLPEFYQQLNGILNKIGKLNLYENQNIPIFKTYIDEFLELGNLILSESENKIDNYVSNGKGFDQLEHKLHHSEIKFDDQYLQQIIEANLPNYCYSPNLFKTNNTIKFIDLKLNGDQQSSTTNYLAESRAINAININTQKPLIVVSGGCKNVKPQDKKNFIKLNEQIIKLGHETKSNISIPCTQSGIGESLSFGFQEYQDKFGSLNENQKMKMFAIAPTKTLYLPNTQGTSQNKGDLYAPSCVDQIGIPYSADWDIQDKDIKNAGYFQFIGGAESIYHRINGNDNRIHIVGNGGLFTIAEINEALKNDSQIILVKGTGRFADVASNIIQDTKFMSEILFDMNDKSTIKDYLNIFNKISEFLKSKLNSDDYEEWIEKDFGKELKIDERHENTKITNQDEFYNVISSNGKYNITSKQLLYRQYLEEFLHLFIKSKKKAISCGVEELEKIGKNFIK